MIAHSSLDILQTFFLFYISFTSPTFSLEEGITLPYCALESVFIFNYGASLVLTALLTLTWFCDLWMSLILCDLFKTLLL